MSQTSLTRLWSVRMTNSAVLARSQTSCDELLSLSGNLCQTSVGNPLTFTANLPKEQLMKATGREGCFYRAPFIINTRFHTKKYSSSDPLVKTGLRWGNFDWGMHQPEASDGAMWWLLYTTKYNTQQPARIWRTHDEEWVKLCSSLPERTTHWCQQSGGASTHLFSQRC